MSTNAGIDQRVWPVRVMWLLGTAYLAALVWHSAGWDPTQEAWFEPLVDGWLGFLTAWAPAVVCWLAVYRMQRRSPELLLSAAALTSFAAGDTYYLLMSVGGGPVPFPSPADLGYLLVYPLLMAALAVTVRRYARGLGPSVWLDCAVGSLGAGAVLTVVLAPVLRSTTAGPLSFAAVVAVAPPALALVLVSAIAGISALLSVRMRGRWALLVLGLVVFAASDAIYGLQVTGDSYALGTPLDSGWAIGLALMATWVDRQARDGRAAAHDLVPATRATALVVSSVATVAGLAVLVVGTRVHLSTLAVTLAGVTLLAAGGRSELAFRLLARMASQRLQAAATDELTGLPNRRALYAEAHARLFNAEHRSHALLMLDLDKFKEVNDILGHRAGDQLLVQVGARLRENLRGDDVLARLGGDEFAVLLDDAQHDEAVNAAARLCAAMSEVFLVEGISLHSSVSIGIALSPDNSLDLSAMLRRADIAMYKAKALSTGYHVYCSADDSDDAARLQLAAELRAQPTAVQLHTAVTESSVAVHTAAGEH